MIINSKGNVYYGMHFYPGVAEYAEPGQDPYRVFLNEDTIRSMDPSFAGRPIFVQHVEEVPTNKDELRKEADGWVIESFYNSADGKHWVKFIVVTEKGEKAIQSGMRLSNAYVPTSTVSSNGKLWNGGSYEKEITGGEYDHLAIVSNPRYEESVIMTPDEFKKYNEDKFVELKRLSNSKEEKGTKKMKLNFFQRKKVENAIDPDLSVVLPKSGRELTITQLVNEADEHEEKKDNEGMADMAHKVKLHDGSMCNVGELLEKHKAMNDELEAMKKENEDESDLEVEKDPVESDSSPEMKNDEEDEDAKKKALELAKHEDKEIAADKKKNAADKKAAKEKADKLRNANHVNAAEETHVIDFSEDQVARGKTRYGSN